MGFFDRLRDSALSAMSDYGSDTSDDDNDSGDGKTRMFTNHAGGYYVCCHFGCSKKVNPYITDHDCCGRCSVGRSCSHDSMERYDGPGSFAHHAAPPADVAIQLGTRTAGICTICDEPLEDHPTYDGW